ncbi:hypothetical protein MPER_06255 [Moniliophthora perniciosa FA553]|nr:hypothetical protein MPER_06255 [Moniliophthora perniciosa FA553]
MCVYLQASHAIIHNLLYLPPDRDFLYVTDTHFTPSNKSHPHSPSHNFEHLSCFLPGLLALGHATLKESDFPSADERELHLWAAEGLAYACWLSYADQKTGLGPDEMGVNSWPQTDSETTSAQGRWSVESFYILWRSTGDEKWRERGWAIFESIERHTKTEHGYATIEEVDSDAPFLKDQMPSFFLAETLKYLYLLFTDDEIMPLDKWVFNTEAHPLPIFEWTAEEKAAYRIS